MDQDIIERKPASPIATSLLVICAVCMLAAMTFMFIELRELKGGENTPKENAEKLVRKGPEVRNLVAKVGDITVKDEDAGSGDDSTGSGDSDSDTGGGKK